MTGSVEPRYGAADPADRVVRALEWLRGSGRGIRPCAVVSPGVEVPVSGPPAGDIELDYVASVDNAVTVIAALHRGEKRLVFCDSRQLAEEIGAALRARGVATFLSHSSLSVDERRQAEQAFAEARDCVIVSTSTLELGIDVGDLDCDIQVNAPAVGGVVPAAAGPERPSRGHHPKLSLLGDSGGLSVMVGGSPVAVGARLRRTCYRAT